MSNEVAEIQVGDMVRFAHQEAPYHRVTKVTDEAEPMVEIEGFVGQFGMSCFIKADESKLTVDQVQPENGGRSMFRSGTQLTPQQCAEQFRLYAKSHPSADAQHQLNFCADFLDEFCVATPSPVPAEQRCVKCGHVPDPWWFKDGICSWPIDSKGPCGCKCVLNPPANAKSEISEEIIGPNPCSRCGCEYGEHSEPCASPTPPASAQTEELLPCPFCGASAGDVKLTRGHGFIIGCNSCQAQQFAMDRDDAVRMWNTRVTPTPSRDAEKEALTCPCLHTTPCDPRCTCVKPHSSRGCFRCCTYGSPEQQRSNAERIAAALSSRGSQLDDKPGWVTFGRVKVDIENETETFERIHQPTKDSAVVSPETRFVIEARRLTMMFHDPTGPNYAAVEDAIAASLREHVTAAFDDAVAIAENCTQDGAARDEPFRIAQTIRAHAQQFYGIQPQESDAITIGQIGESLIDLFTKEAERLHKVPGAFTNRLAFVAAQYITARHFAGYEDGVRAAIEKAEELRATWERGDGLNQLSTRTVGQIRGATKIINALLSLSATPKGSDETNHQ